MIDCRNNGLFTESKTSENWLKNGRRGGIEDSKYFISNIELTVQEGSFILYSLLQGYLCIKDMEA